MGDPRRDRASENLRVIELLAPRVAAGDKDPAHRVAHAMQEFAVARWVEAGILPHWPATFTDISLNANKRKIASKRRRALS